MKTKRHLLQICLLYAAMLPAVVQAQFLLTTNSDGSLNISKYTGSGGVVTIPSTTNGLPITSIGTNAFYGSFFYFSVIIGTNVTSIDYDAFAACNYLTNAVIPSSVTSIGYGAFGDCYKLTSITIPNSVTNIGDLAFYKCIAMTSITIPNGVTSIGYETFDGCASLTNITIPSSVTSIGTNAFYRCSSLKGIYCLGNAPAVGLSVFLYDSTLTAYYLPGTTGWIAFAANTGLTTALWFLPNPLILNNEPSFGVQTNVFGFTISWATNTSVVVEGSTNLANPVWQPVSTNTLTGGTSYFSDPQWTNYPGQFYRLRSP